MLIGPSASIFSHCLTSHHPCQNIQRCESDEQCSDDVTDADDAPSDKRERVGHDFSFLFPSATGIIYPQKKAEVFIHLDKVFHVGCCCCVCVSKRIPPGLTDRWRRNWTRCREKMSCRTTTTRHGIMQQPQKIKTVRINIYYIRREREGGLLLDNNGRVFSLAPELYG